MSKPLFTHLGQGSADNKRIASFQDSLISQMIERRQELPTREIASRTDDDKCMGFNLMVRHPPGPPCTHNNSLSNAELFPLTASLSPLVGHWHK